MKKVFLSMMIFLGLCTGIFSQEAGIHQQSKEYQWPDDPHILNKLDQWQDLKFGMIIHWGLYAVPGVIESWELCSEDWINRPDSMTYEQYKRWYWGLKDQFNPVRFDPDSWARAATDAGMKYVVFTTKHHDGFNMFDTQQTDFKITNGPFASNPKANVAKYVFDAFRHQGFMIGAYFSKPDWHSQDFWWDKYATPNRNVNYDIRKFPERWNRYKNFTYQQISELMHDYGTIDILWLDGGWVRPRESVNKEVLSWGAPIPEWDQQVDIPRIAQMARQAQPGLIIVDRTVHGPYENYQTPERSIPADQLPFPWESCITLGNNWGFVPGEHYKSSTTVIHNLIEIVARRKLTVGRRPQTRWHAGHGRHHRDERHRQLALFQRESHLQHPHHPPLPRWGSIFYSREKRQYLCPLPPSGKCPDAFHHPVERKHSPQGNHYEVIVNGSKGEMDG